MCWCAAARRGTYRFRRPRAYGHRSRDLAIALTYAKLAKAQPVDAAAIIVRAYHDRLPLEAAELDALFPLIGARLCMSICYAAYNARVKSTDAYQQVTAGPPGLCCSKWRACRRICASRPWRHACGL